MTEQEALTIVTAIAGGKPMVRWPEAERWEAVCIVLLKAQREASAAFGAIGIGGQDD